MQNELGWIDSFRPVISGVPEGAHSPGATLGGRQNQADIKNNRPTIWHI